MKNVQCIAMLHTIQSVMNEFENRINCCGHTVCD
jgi:hypothetical protein